MKFSWCLLSHLLSHFIFSTSSVLATSPTRNDASVTHEHPDWHTLFPTEVELSTWPLQYLIYRYFNNNLNLESAIYTFHERMDKHPSLADLHYTKEFADQVGQRFTELRQENIEDMPQLKLIGHFLKEHLQHHHASKEVQESVELYWYRHQNTVKKRKEKEALLGLPDEERERKLREIREKGHARYLASRDRKAKGEFLTLESVMRLEKIPLDLPASEVEEQTRPYRILFDQGASATQALKAFLKKKIEPDDTPRYTAEEIKAALNARSTYNKEQRVRYDVTRRGRHLGRQVSSLLGEDGGNFESGSSVSSPSELGLHSSEPGFFHSSWPRFDDVYIPKIPAPDVVHPYSYTYTYPYMYPSPSPTHVEEQQWQPPYEQYMSTWNHTPHHYLQAVEQGQNPTMATTALNNGGLRSEYVNSLGQNAGWLNFDEVSAVCGNTEDVGSHHQVRP